jgi:aspartate aminotransferase
MSDEQRSALSTRVADCILGSKESWTRRMFELANTMRLDGGGPVHDLSLGNPSLEPPDVWRQAVVALLDEPDRPGRHRYMTNSGFPEVRAFIAERESKRYGLPFEAGDVTMTVGAAGGVNVFLAAVADPGQEVVVPAPFFSEYEHYCANAGTQLVPVATGRGFALDVEALVAAIGPKTRAVVLNSPNNPTGAVYSQESLRALASALTELSAGRECPVYVLEDSPYRDLVYDGSHVPSMLEYYPQTVFATSHSKDLGLAGERIGYLVVSPRLNGRELLARALGFCNRTLGFVNAPALMQRALMGVLGHPEGRVDVQVYADNARRMAATLIELGFELPPPKAGFFLFPGLPARMRSAAGVPAPAASDAEDPGGDVRLTNALRDRRTIVVPGTAFGIPGHLRLAMCVEPEVVTGAIEAFREVCE